MSLIAILATLSNYLGAILIFYLFLHDYLFIEIQIGHNKC